jgi:PadR family transcriptional regulator PadR
MFEISRFLLHRLGRFEQEVIKSIALLGQDAYCVAITEDIGKRLGREVSAGQTSRALSALERTGLISSRKMLPATPAKHRRSRIVYSFSEEGRRSMGPANSQLLNDGVASPAFT